MKYPVLEKERLKRRLTVAELTRTLGVCRKTYYNWQNRGGMPQRAAERTAELFGLSVDRILSRVMLPEVDSDLTGKEGRLYVYQRVPERSQACRGDH